MYKNSYTRVFLGGISMQDETMGKSLPLYQVVIDTIVARIASGELSAGAMLPSETQLGSELGVSQGTARKALIELESRGLVERAQGRGTFVTLQTPDRALFSFFRLRSLDGTPATPKLEHQDISARAASTSEKHALHNSPDRVFSINRLRSLPRGDCILEDIVVPQSMFPGLIERAPLPNTLYVFYQQAYSCIVVRADETLSAVLADETTAKALKVEIGASLLKVERIAFDALDRAVEHRTSFIHARFHRYDVTLK